jgi:two-component system nitrogen regulation response regulator GlnG
MVSEAPGTPTNDLKMEVLSMMERNPLILIVDDDESLVDMLVRLMKREGFETVSANDGDAALRIVSANKPDLMLLDIKMGDMDGMEVLRQAKELDQALSIIILTGYHDPHGAVSAIKAGAYDYFAKPFESSELIHAVHQALAEKGLQRNMKDLSGRLHEGHSLKEVMGPSDAVTRVISEVNRVAGSDFTVVIVGETGSGKELIARAIHEASSRSKGPFIPVDCGAIPETLLESELFGHEKGAFTGAEVQKPGKFELAQGGTLFLDEISNMPPGSQAKLLRVLQEKKVYRVGGTKPIGIDVRLVVASNQDLHELTVSTAFRRDLFYRLSEFSIAVPPLRERKEDIPYLAKRFLDTANLELKKKVKGFSESAINVLFSYNWPGNVRQLRSTIRRAALLADETIGEKDLDLKRVPVPGLAFTPKVEGTPWKGLSLKEIVEESSNAVEREILTQVMKQVDGNKAKAARLLQIDYKTIHSKLKKLGITHVDVGVDAEPGMEIERPGQPHSPGGPVECAA